MRYKRVMSFVLVCVMVIGCVCVPVGAAEKDSREEEIVTRATGKFSLDIKGGAMVTADIDFPLEIGETVTINASYTPRSASVDFGLIAPDGLFYPVRGTNGSINKTIKVNQRGYFTFAIRNNSSSSISVTGFVNY